ncbi:MAG: hypothetical protein ACOX9C_09710 [Kiritimatiellia bacterium]|jgi:hypothetical protein
MRTSFAALALFAAAAATAAANSVIGLNVMAKLAHVEYVYAEAIPLTVTVQNPGNKAFILDDYPPYDANSFMIALRTREGRIIFPIKGREPTPELTIKPGDAATFDVNLNQIFGPLPEGHYLLSAVVNRGQSSFSSKIVPLTIVNGIEIGSAMRAKPGRDDIALSYTLLYWARSGKEFLFLRIVEKPTDAIYGFAQLGSVVRIAQPRIDFGEGGISIVTYQTSRDNFMRVTFDASGPELQHVGSQPMVSAAAVAEEKATQRAMESVERYIEEKNKAEGGKFFRRRTNRVRKLPEGAPKPKE